MHTGRNMARMWPQSMSMLHLITFRNKLVSETNALLYAKHILVQCIVHKFLSAPALVVSYLYNLCRGSVT